MSERYDAAVIGAGFFGVRHALLLARRGARVVLIEREGRICARASWANQARIHNGYHYPRSLSTANGSHRHYERFLREMPGGVDEGFTHLYAIAGASSAITTAQFERFCRELGLPLVPAPRALARLFDPSRIEAVFKVREGAFDIRTLREGLERDLAAQAGIRFLAGIEALRLELGAGRVRIATSGPQVEADATFLVAYAGINRLLLASGLTPLDLKAELAEICLVEPPLELAGTAVTVMDGPFFSLTPMPGEAAHAFTHVRYTPQASWDLKTSQATPYVVARRAAARTRFPFMQRDAERYLPVLRSLRQRGSLFEVKAIPSRREIDDGRPILVRQHSRDPLCVSILGSKLDSVFELEDAVERLLDRPG